ncbi:hypothetical protein BC829DRAFT_414727 [Chytridium lagenaria]|nr:hypothetical protein BC829DRAFT_414727 [Chytridium lagenaria]
MHNPRGSNNRCDERSNDVKRDNRMFDSQNNNAGGYATCPEEMVFYEGTKMDVMYTAQHGCGNGDMNKNDPNNPEISHCQIIIQLGCEDTFSKLQPVEATQYWPYKLTDGRSAVPASVAGDTCIDRRPLMYNDCAVITTATHPFAPPSTSTTPTNEPPSPPTNAAAPRVASSHTDSTNPKSPTQMLRPPPQPRSLHRRPKSRSPMVGQNDRDGFECPEERDYYPYWKPLDGDIAIKVSDMSLCPFYQARSENVLGRCECVNPNNATDPTFWLYEHRRLVMDSVAQWPSWMGVNGGRQANQASYQMTIPSIVPMDRDELKCTLRLRYNISNANVPFFATSANNGILKNNPVVFFGNRSDETPAKAMPFRLAVNTAQVARTFEDRSYVFRIKKRTPDLQGKTIHNLNVRGKRGNIAQVRNNVEYDFVPNVLKVKQDDLVHFQWCGSDYNDQNNAGQGTAGTDRTNIVAVPKFDSNSLLPMINNNFDTNPNAEVAPTMFDQETLSRLAWQDQNSSLCFNVTEMLTTQAQNQQDPQSCHFLNQAKAYFTHMARVTGPGVMYYMSTRNNNFSNRSQKGVIIADANGLSVGAIAGIAIGSVAGVGAMVAAGLMVYKRKHGSMEGLKYHMMGRV